jgi:type IV pilus biogenesis protein CpaD/CtpE
VTLKTLSQFAVVLSLSACTMLPESEAPVRVEQNQVRHVIPVGPGGTVSVAEQQVFDRFLHGAAAGNPYRVHLTLRGTGPASDFKAVTRMAVVDQVQPTKIEIDRVSNTAASAPPAGQIEAIVTVASLAPTDCPDLSHVISTSDWRNQASSNLGCAYNMDLAEMAADPADLVQGESGGQTDSVLTSAAIDRLHTGKVKDIAATGSKAQ